MATTVPNIAAVRLTPTTVLIRVQPHQSVSMGGSKVNVVEMPSGIVIPVDDDSSRRTFQHQTLYYVERCGSETSRWKPGMRVYLREHPGCAEVSCDGVEYRLIPECAIKHGFEVVEVTV